MDNETTYTMNIKRMIEKAAVSGDYDKIIKFTNAITPSYNIRGINTDNPGFYKK
jgi:hypothetical protein